MSLRLINNTSRIVNINLPKYGISFILAQNESRPGFSKEYIERMRCQIDAFGLTVVDESEDVQAIPPSEDVIATVAMPTETKSVASATVTMEEPITIPTETKSVASATVTMEEPITIPTETKSVASATVTMEEPIEELAPPKKKRTYRRRVKG